MTPKQPLTQSRQSAPLPDNRALAEAFRLSFSVLRIVMIALLAMTLLRSSIFIVPQQQKAFVLRFGRITGHGPSRIREPGPHLAFPVPIDEIVRLPGEQILTINSDSFHHGLDGLDQAAATTVRRRPYFRVAMTANRNLLHSRWTLRYAVLLPEKYVFEFNDIERLLRHELDRAVLLAMARTDVDRVLRADRELHETVHRILAGRVDALGLGIRIHQVESGRITPPPAVADAFDNVVIAEQESSEIASQARTEAALIIGEARSEAADRLATAQAQAVRMTEKTAADAATLQSFLNAGMDSPDTLLSNIMRMERVSRLLHGQNAPRIIRLRTPPEKRELRLLLSGEEPAAHVR